MGLGAGGGWRAVPGAGCRMGRVRRGEEALGPGPRLQCALSAGIRRDQDTRRSRQPVLVILWFRYFICDIAWSFTVIRDMIGCANRWQETRCQCNVFYLEVVWAESSVEPKGRTFLGPSPWREPSLSFKIFSYILFTYLQCGGAQWWAGDVLNISVFWPGSAPCQLRQDAGCIKILLLMCDLSLDTRAWANRENWEVWHQSDQTGNMSKRRGEWHISSFSECDGGWGNMTPRYPYYLLLITIRYLIASKNLHTASAVEVSTKVCGTQNLEKEPTITCPLPLV